MRSTAALHPTSGSRLTASVGQESSLFSQVSIKMIPELIRMCPLAVSSSENSARKVPPLSPLDQNSALVAVSESVPVCGWGPISQEDHSWNLVCGLWVGKIGPAETADAGPA